MATLEYSITASADDCDETTRNGLDTSFVTLRFGEDYWGYGLRFLNVAIPQGTTITDAYLTFYGNYDVREGRIDINTYGIDKDDCAGFTSFNLPSSQDKTDASTYRSYQGTTSWPGDYGIIDHSLDVTDQVQEIVDRGGWESGNDLGFIGEITQADGTGGIDSYDNEVGAPPPKLTVEIPDAGSSRRIFIIKY